MIAARIYRLLLRLYPSPFRREYQEPMEQAFRDQLRDADTGRKRRRLWVRTGVDLMRSIFTEHLRTGRGRRILMALAACLFGLSASVFLGRFELHTDDTGVEVFFILVYTFILGCWYPKQAWLTPLLSLSIPLAEWAWGHPHGSLQHPSDLVILAGVVTVIGLIGSYSGVLIRKVIIDNILR